MRQLFYTAATLGLLMSSDTFASCDAKAEGSISYFKAETFVYTLPEVKAWRKLVYAVPGRKVITIPSFDHQLLINGRCYWSVTLFEDTPNKYTRWNQFYIRDKDQHILVGDITGGDPMTLKQWRAQQKQLDANPSRANSSLKQEMLKRAP